MIGPAFSNLDSSLMKEATPFKVKDHPVNTQFRWEFFNIFNHPNFGFPGSTSWHADLWAADQRR